MWDIWLNRRPHLAREIKHPSKGSSSAFLNQRNHLTPTSNYHQRLQPSRIYNPKAKSFFLNLCFCLLLSFFYFNCYCTRAFIFGLFLCWWLSLSAIICLFLVWKLGPSFAILYLHIKRHKYTNIHDKYWKLGPSSSFAILCLHIKQVLRLSWKLISNCLWFRSILK